MTEPNKRTLVSRSVIRGFEEILARPGNLLFLVDPIAPIISMTPEHLLVMVGFGKCEVQVQIEFCEV